MICEQPGPQFHNVCGQVGGCGIHFWKRTPQRDGGVAHGGGGMREVRSDRVLEGGGKGKGQIRDAMNRKRVFECTARSNNKLAGSAERGFRYPCLRPWDNMQIRDGGYGNRERTAACHRVGLEEECKKRRIGFGSWHRTT